MKAAADELPDGGGALAARALCMRTWVLLLTTGLRPEEAQALCWESRRSRGVDGRGVALGQGPQLTPRRPKSRRTLRLAQIALDALRRPDGNLLRSSLRAL